MANDNTRTDHDTGVPRNPTTRERSDLPFPVVGLGASAGGLPALKAFLQGMPKKPGLAFVVILHLSPKHESVADKVLQTSSRMPVLQVTQPTPLEPDHVYVISPNQDLTMSDGHLSVKEADRPRGHHVAIDLFFRTLADTHQDKAIGIVLSGTGADGAVGIARIKEQGGVTFVQSPEDAEYDDMPRSAIASGKIDFVLPAAEMPDKLIEWWKNAREIKLPEAPDADAPILQTPPDASEASERALREILENLAVRSGHDFRCYKRATVLRRIERRMQVTVQPTLPAYRDYLKQHPEEARALLDDMLIGVTNFFRDRESFEALEREVIPEIMHGGRRDEPVRVWVPGCASGEEAYSIAMLLADQAQTLATPPPFQVFASDIDEAAIALGRAGAYPESIITDVPPARLRQFFGKEQQRYRINKAIRDRVLFALHNVLRDPPFSRIDLISCRNLLIYLDRKVQVRLLEMFHFALRPGGYLFLGSSESSDGLAGHFEVVDKHHRIYRARPLARSMRQASVLPLSAGAPLPVQPEQAGRRREFSFADVHQRVLEFYAPPSVIVDREGNIVHLSDQVGRYLRLPGGEPTRNLVAATDPALRAELRSTLFQAVHSNKSVEARVKVEEDGKPPRFVNIVARPFREPEAGADFVLVLFDEVEDALGANLEPAPGSETQKSAVLQNMEEELQRTRERLQSTVEQYEASNEELKASNEELQAINEELRSASEELETSKEELQSVNEELTTVNYELKTKVEETAKVNDDLQNFIASTDIATVFVDQGLRIKRFTPRATDIFNIIPGDVGRSLLDITGRLDYPQLTEDATAAFESLKVTEREVRSADGNWYAVRVLPYRTADNHIDGAVLNFIDITSLRRAEELISSSEDQLRRAMEGAREHGIIVLDDEGKVTSWSSGAEKLFGWNAEEMIGQSIERLFTPEDREAGRPQREMEQAEQTGRSEDTRWHLRKNGERVFCAGLMSHIKIERFHGYIKIINDATLTELRRRDRASADMAEARSEGAASGAMKDEFLAVISHELKNPLNLISVSTELLARVPDARESPSIRSALDMIRRAIRGQGKIIDDLLDLQRIRTGKLELNFEAVDMSAVACNIVETADADASSTGLELSCTQAEEPVMVRADTARLEQIVWNLVGNAIKFTPPGGHVEVRISRDGNFGKLSVHDDGQGIDKAFMSRIFEMFGQAPSRALSGKGGLGIGLALVKQLVERHGGRIEVESPGLGQGSTFNVWLPRFEYPVLAAPREQSAAADGAWKGVRVLIVDDAAEAAQTFGRLLEMDGAQVTVAGDGEQALAEFERAQSAQAEPGKAPFDIVFADIGMPKMDGYELAQRLRALPSGSQVPLVALTGFTRTDDVLRANEAGFDAHIGKPLSIGQLTATMQRLLPERGGDGHRADGQDEDSEKP